ncbi:hypothetical protein B0T16DRAFT_125669 [Cercophora newfieldiana]|uniref:Uncharacterized protein n=1 Tax=Cercophora newfieldiana TaxID=92897 RepID=A0AA39YAL2_9PEZI|nr:hypothetical protein B0T16DRAFT_125669 [Cercophora newfieldiana]
MDPATIASIVTLAVGAAIKIPDINHTFKDILRSGKDLKDLQLYGEFCKDRLSEFKAEVNRLDIPTDLYRQTKNLIRYSRGVVQGLVEYNKKYGNSFWARCMHWAVSARRSRTEIFERRLQECALWVRIASATSFLLAYRDTCGQVSGMLELCQTRAQQLREDVVQAEKYWKKHPRRMEKYMEVHVKLRVFQRYWYLANDPLFSVLKSELSTPTGTVLGLSSTDEPPRQFWRGIPVAMAAGPARRQPDQDAFAERQNHGVYSSPPATDFSPCLDNYPSTAAPNPWYPRQGANYYPFQHGGYMPDRHEPRPSSPSNERAGQPQSKPLITPPQVHPTPEGLNAPNHGRASANYDDGIPSMGPHRRHRRHNDDHTRHESPSGSRDQSGNRGERDSLHIHQTSHSRQRSEHTQRSESSTRYANDDSSSRRSHRTSSSRHSYSQRSSNRQHRAEASHLDDDDHVYDTTRSSSTASTMRDSIFSRAPSLSSKSSYTSTPTSEYSSVRTEKSRRSSHSGSIEVTAPEPQKTRGSEHRSRRSDPRDAETEKRCPPLSAMNKTKARERVRREERRSRANSTSEERRGRSSRRDERRS